MEIEKMLALAYDGALCNWANAKENYSQYPTNLNRKACEKRWNELKEVTQLQREYEEEIEDECDPIISAINQIESQYKERLTRMTNTKQNFAGNNDDKYMVYCVPLNESVNPWTKFFSSKNDADRFFSEGAVRVRAEAIKANVYLYEKLIDGRWHQLKVEKFLKEPQPQQPQEYAVDAIHLNNEIQRLRFENRKAADAMYEMLRYELKAGRIQRAVLLEKTAEGYKVIKDIERDDV